MLPDTQPIWRKTLFFRLFLYPKRTSTYNFGTFTHNKGGIIQQLLGFEKRQFNFCQQLPTSQLKNQTGSRGRTYIIRRA